MFHFKKIKIKKLSNNEIDEIRLLAYNQFQNKIDENIIIELFNEFIKQLQLVCKNIIVVYKDNKIVCVIPYEILNKTKCFSSIQLFIKNKSNLIDEYKNILISFWTIVNLIEYEIMKNEKSIAFFFIVYLDKKIDLNLISNEIYQFIKHEIKSLKPEFFYYIYLSSKYSDYKLNISNQNLIFEENLEFIDKDKYKFQFWKVGIEKHLHCNKNNQNQINVFGQFVNINDLSIHYYPSNKEAKQTILLIHGLCSSSKTWKQIIKEMNDAYNIYTIDLPLHHKNLKYGDWDIFKISILINEYFKKINKKDKLIIWGHSLGAAIAVIINLLNDNLVDKLILEAPYTYLNQTISKMIYSLIKGYSEVSKSHRLAKDSNTDSFYEKFKEIYLPIKMNTISFLRSVFDKDILKYLNIAYLENKKKTLVIISRDDFVINYKLTHNYFDSLPNYFELQVVELCWHSPHFHQPKNIANLVKKFIN